VSTRIGSLDRDKGMKNWVVGITDHPKYNGRTKCFDFALLELKSLVEGMEPITIAKQTVESYDSVTLYG
jgi:hypothetical protein